MTFFPWQMICATHPIGQEHHAHDGPSPCELRRQYKGEAPVFWPHMHCDEKLSAVDVYTSQDNSVIVTIRTVVVIAVLFEVFKTENQEQHFQLPPEPKCRSATLLSDIPLRAPPLV